MSQFLIFEILDKPYYLPSNNILHIMEQQNILKIPLTHNRGLISWNSILVETYSTINHSNIIIAKFDKKPIAIPISKLLGITDSKPNEKYSLLTIEELV